MKQLDFGGVVNQNTTSDTLEKVIPDIKVSDFVKEIQQYDNISVGSDMDVSCETDTESSSNAILSPETDTINLQSNSKCDENIDIVQYFTHPVTLYRSPDYLYPFCKVSGTVHIAGTPINGFISADAVKTGIGRVKGYIKSSLIEK